MPGFLMCASIVWGCRERLKFTGISSHIAWRVRAALLAGGGDEEACRGFWRLRNCTDALTCLRPGNLEPKRVDLTRPAQNAARLRCGRNPKASDVSGISWSWMADW